MTACDDFVISQETIKNPPLGEGLTDAQCALLAWTTLEDALSVEDEGRVRPANSKPDTEGG